MTDKLRALMDERASQPEFASPDLSLLRSSGQRRRRQRRAAVLGGGLAATAAVTAVTLVAAGLVGGSGGEPEVAADPPASAVPSAFAYALGDVIHDGDTEIEVGHPVRAFVTTSGGYVTADEEGRVWSVTGDGVEQVGITRREPLRLVSDPTTGLAAWLDVDSPAVVAFDQADGALSTYDVRLRVPASGPTGSDDTLLPGHLYALDGGIVYVRDGRDAVAIDLASGERTVVDPGVRGGYDVVDATAGRLAFVEDDRVSVGPTRSTTTSTFEVVAPEAELSPDAAYLAVTGDEGPVYDTTTGLPVDLGIVGFYEPVLWADETTLVAITVSSSSEGERASLLGCDVVRRACAVEVDLGLVEELEEEIVLPDGTT